MPFVYKLISKYPLKGQNIFGMPQSLSQIYLHIVFSTKKRYPFIKSEIEDELYAYFGGTIKRLGGIPFKINGASDHKHIFSSLPRTVSVSKFLEEIKRNSSRWIKTKGMPYQKFAWQGGYSAFSVSSSQKDKVVKYIESQKDHHKLESFQNEVLKFLGEYEVGFDERYLWD